MTLLIFLFIFCHSCLPTEQKNHESISKPFHPLPIKPHLNPV